MKFKLDTENKTFTLLEEYGLFDFEQINNKFIPQSVKPIEEVKGSS